MKTNFYLLTVLVFAIQVMVKSQTPANQAFQHNAKFVLGYAYYTEQEKREFSSIQDPSELYLKADVFVEQAKQLKNDARTKSGPERDRLFAQAKELYRKAEICQLAASELLAYYNRVEFSICKSSFISLLNSYSETDSITIQSKKLLLTAVRAYKLAKEMREEAYAQSTNAAIIANLRLAEEKELIALQKLVEARELLKTGEPVILATR
jgi:hypothetical protein